MFWGSRGSPSIGVSFLLSFFLCACGCKEKSVKRRASTSNQQKTTISAPALFPPLLKFTAKYATIQKKNNTIPRRICLEKADSNFTDTDMRDCAVRLCRASTRANGAAVLP
jgi:hypothetical protein